MPWIRRARPDEWTCPRCGRTFPRTAEFWYFDRSGYINGYCRQGCHTAYTRAWYAAERARRLAARQPLTISRSG